MAHGVGTGAAGAPSRQLSSRRKSRARRSKRRSFTTRSTRSMESWFETSAPLVPSHEGSLVVLKKLSFCDHAMNQSMGKDDARSMKNQPRM
jgi:hypothetical protein